MRLRVDKHTLQSIVSTNVEYHLRASGSAYDTQSAMGNGALRREVASMVRLAVEEAFRTFLDQVVTDEEVEAAMGLREDR